MKLLLLKIENVCMILVAIYVYFYIYDFTSLILLLCLFLPDLFMLAYLVNKKTGAYIYNMAHNLIITSILLIIGMMFVYEIVIYIGLILFIHIFMDRVCGFGLKYVDDFSHTHLN